MSTSRVEVAAPVVLPWGSFQELFARNHRQGEHVAIVGATGGGKSTLGLELAKIIAKRRATSGRPVSVVILATKPRDDTLTRLGWPVVKEWPPKYGQEACIVWPKARRPSTAAAELRSVYKPLLDTIYHEGAQTVVIDEAADFEEDMRLKPTMRRYWRTGRSLKLTLIAGTQRPVAVDRNMWAAPSWIMIFTPEDEDDLKRVAELSGRKREVLEIVPQLGGHEFLVVRRQRDGQRGLYVSRVERAPSRAPGAGSR